MKFLLVSLLLSLSFSQDCYESTIVSPTPFMGNNGEVFKLSDGSNDLRYKRSGYRKTLREWHCRCGHTFQKWNR